MIILPDLMIILGKLMIIRLWGAVIFGHDDYNGGLMITLRRLMFIGLWENSFFINSDYILEVYDYLD